MVMAQGQEVVEGCASQIWRVVATKIGACVHEKSKNRYNV